MPLIVLLDVFEISQLLCFLILELGQWFYKAKLFALEFFTFFIEFDVFFANVNELLLERETLLLKFFGLRPLKLFKINSPCMLPTLKLIGRWIARHHILGVFTRVNFRFDQWKFVIGTRQRFFLCWIDFVDRTGSSYSFPADLTTSILSTILISYYSTGHLFAFEKLALKLAYLPLLLSTVFSHSLNLILQGKRQEWSSIILLISFVAWLISISFNLIQ